MVFSRILVLDHIHLFYQIEISWIFLVCEYDMDNGVISTSYGLEDGKYTIER